ncbi:hypothetical protein CCM_08858 [Cordyceps militaris CM01]|uniref:Uncharacterized protein n=1 Tax=Cordyceps militaris (strain CM01) TaxID=983644 RepID=G3JSB3_CORMM|nr:uncharacterized protein CCM_08858 [Cordyceps militaris CM01]EGX88812.1 hypothetical protein CCM_08858 [Cordyceps militaris CM01]
MSVMASRPPSMPAAAGGSGMPSKRPRLSLQIKTNNPASTTHFAQRPAITTATRPCSLNPSDPTAFNTLSNAYVTAIERAATPVASPVGEPLTAIRNMQAISLCSPTLGPAPARSSFPATPLSAYPSSSPSKPMLPLLLLLPSVMSPTPPVSAGAVEMGSRVFSFSPRDAAAGRHSLEQALHAAAAAAAAATTTTTTTTTPSSPVITPPKQQSAPPRTTLSASPPPYTHAKALRSILRNSPLPSRRPNAAATSSPRGLAPTVRIQTPDVQRAAKRVCYHSPIEQEIITNTYTKSHIDLLVDEASTMTTSPRGLPVDLSRAFSANEIQDGGQTPGPFEDENRRLGAALRSADRGTTTAPPPRSEKKRRWVWTIGREEDAEEDEEQLGGAVVAAARAAAAAAAAGEERVTPAPVLSVPKPEAKLDAGKGDVEMSS